MRRIIGSYTQDRPGPLLICIAGLHGNEWAGVHALDFMIRMLQVELITNPDFRFFGKVIALTGNIPALRVKRRFLHSDLNRMWIRQLIKNPGNESESGELLRLKELIDQLILDWGGKDIYILDLHTTTAEGGIFALPTSSGGSIRIAKAMSVPVIMGLAERLQGTLVKYYGDRLDADITPLVFEAGQHDDPLSVNRAIASVTNCMVSIGVVKEEDVENRHNALLIEYAQNLPKMAEIRYIHHITPEMHFVMKKGYQNFDRIEEGEHLANDLGGPIHAQEGGMILMPLYQPQGTDGYFIIKELN